MSIRTVNPSTNKTVKSFEEMTQKSVEAKEVKAQTAFTDWKETSYRQRADLLPKAATLMRVKKTPLADKVLDPEYVSALIRNSPIGVLFGVMPW